MHQPDTLDMIFAVLIFFAPFFLVGWVVYKKIVKDPYTNEVMIAEGVKRALREYEQGEYEQEMAAQKQQDKQ